MTKQSLRIALAQYDFPVGAVQANAEKIISLAHRARDQHHADVVLFPELAISGYPPEDLLNRPDFLADCESAIRKVAESIEGIVAIVPWPTRPGRSFSMRHR